MKKQLFTGALLLWGGTLHAQIEKGNGILSGTVSINYSQTESTLEPVKRWQPAANLTVGRFVADNWLAGLSVGATTSFATESQLVLGRQFTNRNNTLTVTTTPFVRRYWKFTTGYVFAGAGLAVAVSGSRQTGVESSGAQVNSIDNRNRSVNVSPRLEAGLNYFFTNRLALQLAASTNSIPFNTAGLDAGLVYWTGPGRKASPQRERTNPQTDAGRWLVEGSFSVNNQSADQYQTTIRQTSRVSSTTYSISPSVGYFIGKNKLLGVSLPLSWSSFRSELLDETGHVWSVGVSPYYQQYWTSTRLTPFTRVNASYTYLKFDVDNDVDDLSSYGAGVSVGLAYMAGQRFIIETSLGNASVNVVDTNGPNKAWNASITAGLTGNFAIRYVFK
ncbi:outer membrane beta-barrel protein [Fibrisoma limi]|nr:outer membrane beta-barrel protein [Fibrisoma limi]